MSDAQELIKKMRAAKGAQKPTTPSKSIDPKEMQVRLIIAVHRRRQLMLFVAISFFIFLTILANDMNIDKPWWITGLPIIGLGLMISLVPPTEEWEYRPWQTRARQYERHQLER